MTAARNEQVQPDRLWPRLEALFALPGPSLTTPAGRALVLRACDIFPQSARLATLAGQVLREVGEEDAALAQLARAGELHRAASIYRREFPREDGTLHLWQFAEHIRKWRKEPRTQ